MSGRPTASKNPLSTPPTGHTPDQISNREALRLETPATQTKRTAQPHSNREKEACFSPPVGEGVYLPLRLGLGVGWHLGGMRAASDSQNSNREGRRLESGVKQTKQRIRVSSNREKEACFPAPVGEGVHHPPGLALGVNWDLAGMRAASNSQISNREALRLETLATQTKQRTQPRSNREKAEVFALSLPPMGPAKPPNSNRDTILLETHANS